MTEDLRDQLLRTSERGRPRGADEVFAAAVVEGPRHRRRALVAGAVVVSVLAGLLVIGVVSTRPDRTTTVSSERAPSTATGETTTTAGATSMASPLPGGPATTLTSMAAVTTTLPVERPTPGSPAEACFDGSTRVLSRTVGVSPKRLWTGDGYSTATSVDGGSTWQWQCDALGELLEGIVPVDDRLAWAYTHNAPGLGEPALYRTTDGGATWAHVPLAQLGWEGRGIVCDLEFPEPRRGFMVVNRDQHAMLYRTTDGSTWTAASLPTSESCSVSFADATHGWTSWREGERATLHATSDGGTSWRAVAVPDGALALRSLALADRDSGFVVGLSSDWTTTFLSSTSDGGATWRRADLPADAVLALDASTAIAVSIGHGAGPLRIWRTTDAGRSWQEVDYGVDEVEPTGMAWVPLVYENGRVYLGTVKKSILVSDDRGVTWRRVGIGLRD